MSFRDTILAHLKGRSQEDCNTLDPETHKPVYVIRMCEELLKAILEKGGTCDLQDVLRADSLAAGHVDYVAKLSLYCDELARGVFYKRA